MVAITRASTATTAAAPAPHPTSPAGRGLVGPEGAGRRVPGRRGFGGQHGRLRLCGGSADASTIGQGAAAGTGPCDPGPVGPWSRPRRRRSRDQGEPSSVGRRLGGGAADDLRRPPVDGGRVPPVAGHPGGQAVRWTPARRGQGGPPKVTCPRAPIRRARAATWRVGGMSGTCSSSPTGPLLNSQTGMVRSAAPPAHEPPGVAVPAVAVEGAAHDHQVVGPQGGDVGCRGDVHLEAATPQRRGDHAGQAGGAAPLRSIRHECSHVLSVRRGPRRRQGVRPSGR